MFHKVCIPLEEKLILLIREGAGSAWLTGDSVSSLILIDDKYCCLGLYAFLISLLKEYNTPETSISL